MTPAELATFEVEVRSGRMPLWHGGYPSLTPGDPLLPPSATGSTGMREEAVQQGLPKVISFTDRVYLTSAMDLARAVAANYWHRSGRRGSLYRVELSAHPLELDRDLPRSPFICFETRAAVVSEVVEIDVDPDAAEHADVLRKFIAQIR